MGCLREGCIFQGKEEVHAISRKNNYQRKLGLALTPSVESQRTCSLYCPGKHPHLSACKNSKRLLNSPYNVKQVQL